MPGLRVIVTGLIGQYPLGGVAWDYLQYVLGLSRLGHDVYYFEDTGQSPYVPELGGLSDDPAYTVTYLERLMEQFGLSGKWAYHFPYPVPQWFGLGDSERQAVIESADLLLNVSGTLARPQDYRQCRRLVFLDSDPVFTQIKLARGQHDFRSLVDMHDIHFSLGETLPGNAPATGHVWLPTRPPVVMEYWVNDIKPRDVFTTVMNWTSYNPVSYEGVEYGQKDIEFRKYIDLPGKVSPVRLEIAVNDGKTKRTPRDLLAHKGWSLADPSLVCPDADQYRSYIMNSLGEWSVAKNGYVTGRSGWFSCRSVCYLAAGRPVVVQDTGFSDVIPTGDGIIAFTSLEEAVSGIQAVAGDYDRHTAAARDLAARYFDSDMVLEDMLARVT